MWFTRYWTFYEQTTEVMNQYRLLHVRLISEVYNLMMIALGDRIEEVRAAVFELDGLIDDRRAQIGNTACVQGVVEARDANNARVGANINACATYGNVTMSRYLTQTFYPTFAIIQDQTSIIPISVIDILARGNVLQDEQEILQYMADRYQAFEMQWLAAVSQLLRWESQRFDVEARFLADQTTICMADGTWEFMLTNSRLEGEIQFCE